MNLDIKKTQEGIELAKKAVEHMDNDEYKMKSFEVILNKLLEGKNPSFKEIPEKRTEPPKEENSFPEKPKGINKLIEDAGIKEEQFYSLFDVEGKQVNILDSPKSKNSSEEQFMNSLLLLVINYYLTGLHELSSSILRKKLEVHGIGSLVNLSTNLNTKKKYIFRKQGKKGNTDTSYKITFPGIREGLNLIGRLSSENDQEKK